MFWEREMENQIELFNRDFFRIRRALKYEADIPLEDQRRYLVKLQQLSGQVDKVFGEEYETTFKYEIKGK